MEITQEGQRFSRHGLTTLKEGAPSAKSCWMHTYGFALKEEDISLNKFPSASCFRYKLEKEMPESAIYLARYGHAKWNRKYANYIDRDYSALECGSLWCSDHAQIDVLVLGSNGKAISPFVTAWRDFKSSKWLSWDLHEEPGNSDHIFQTFHTGAIEYGKILLNDNRLLNIALTARGLTKETIAFCDIGYDVKEKKWVFPIYCLKHNAEITGFEFRPDLNLKKTGLHRTKKVEGTHTCIAQINKFTEKTKTLVIVEGYIDAYILLQYFNEKSLGDSLHIVTPIYLKSDLIEMPKRLFFRYNANLSPKFSLLQMPFFGLFPG